MRESKWYWVKELVKTDRDVLVEAAWHVGFFAMVVFALWVLKEIVMYNLCAMR